MQTRQNDIQPRYKLTGQQFLNQAETGKPIKPHKVKCCPLAQDCTGATFSKGCYDKNEKKKSSTFRGGKVNLMHLNSIALFA